MPDTNPVKVCPGQHRVFRFGAAAFDEGSLELRVDGVVRDLDAKARTLLVALLEQPNTVLSTDEILAAVWPGVLVSEGSVTNAVYVLRKALCDDKRVILQSVPKFGYKISVPVATSLVASATDPRLPMQSGGKVPGRPQWRLDRRLGAESGSDVWVARHEKTSETRVFKFGRTPERLDSLKREAALSRLLNDKLGTRSDIVRISEWNFDEQPYFIESPYGGADLLTWMGMVDGAGAPSLAARVAIVAQVARTVADAHDAGVIHGDIKPLNILIADTGDSAVRTRLVDFGVGGLTPAARTQLLTISLESLEYDSARGKAGTFLYMAPEVRHGGPPTVAGDIYALGILLYQMVVGDLGRPLAADWEGDIEDALLRQDIAAAAAGDPARRLDSAKVLVRQLETLDERRAETAEQFRLRMQRDAEHEQLVRTADLRRVEAAASAERARHAILLARRTRLAASAMLILLFGTVVLAVYAFQEKRVAVGQRDRANRITVITEAAVSGLIDDIAQGIRARSVLTGADLEKLLDRAESTISSMSRLAPEALQLRTLEARTLTKFADLHLHQGDVTKALAAANRAVSIETALLTADPNNADLQSELAESERWIGDAKLKQRDLEGALVAYQTALNISKHLASADTASPERKIRLARAYEAVGDVMLAKGDYQSAFALYRIASGIISAVVAGDATNSEWQLDLSAAQEKIGDTLEAAKDWRGALAAYTSDLQIRQRLYKLEPLNMRWQRDLSVAYADVGDEERELNNLNDALTSYRAASALDRERLSNDPDRAQWESDVALSNDEIADTLVLSGDRNGAVELYKEAVTIFDSLTKKDTSDTEFAIDLVENETSLADDLLKLGRAQEARPYSVRALADARKLAADHPNDAYIKKDEQTAEALAKRIGAQ